MSQRVLSVLAADTSLPVLEQTVGGLLRDVAENDPDYLALSVWGPGSEPTQWTYGELRDDAERAATWLLQKLRPGQHIVVWAPNSAEWIILQYAAGIAGLVLVTANPALRAGELAYVLAQSESAAIAYVSEFRGTDMEAIVAETVGNLEPAVMTINFAGWLDEVRATTPQPHMFPEVRSDDPVQLQYTSGTTGSPKGALLTHRGMITNAAYVHRRAEFPEHATWLTALPLFHTAGCGMSVLGCATSKATLVICQIFDPTLVLTALERTKATLYAGVPAMYIGLLAHPRFADFDFSELKITASGGDAVPPELVRRVEEAFGSRFSTVYGQTELSPIVTQTSPSDSLEDKCDTVGRPLWNVDVRVEDPETGGVVALGERGEICARGYQTMICYFNMPEETSAVLTSDGWLHTGDLGSLDERGYLRITGRKKDMIIRGGENIYPREIELVLLTHPSVVSAVVVGLPDPQWGESIAAVLMLRDGAAPPTAAEMHDLVRSRIAPAKTPKSWYVTTEFPVNSMGKFQKFKLRDLIAAGELPSL